jgi:hypothetical protein
MRSRWISLLGTIRFLPILALTHTTTCAIATHIALIKGSAIEYYWYIARNLKIAFQSSQQRHDLLWDILFLKKEWLSVALEIGLISALVGYSVRKCYYGSCKPAYIVLVTSDYSRDLQEQRKLLLDCLKLDNKKR